METSEAGQTPIPKQLTPKEKQDLQKQRKREELEAVARTLNQEKKDTLLYLGRYGALIKRDMEPYDWQTLVTEHYIRVYQTLLGPVLALTSEGRLVHDTIGGGALAPYLNGPTSVVDRAYQVLAVRHLEAQGYSGEAVERRPRNLNAAARAVKTDLIVCFRMRPPEVRYPDDIVEAIGYPPLYASIGQGGAGVPQLQRHAQQHGAHVTVWKHPVMVAVRKVTPAMARLVATLQESKRCEVLRLIEIPVTPLASG